MPKRILPRIAEVTPGKAPYTLCIRWERGGQDIINVSQIIQNFRVYAPLRRSLALFRRVSLGDYGTDIVWSDKMDMSADTLWRLAQEQNGKTMTADAFRNWRARRDYTLDAAASALGISRRMVVYYDHGDKPIPRVVALATQVV